MSVSTSPRSTPSNAQIKYIKRASVDCGAAAADYETKVKEAKSAEDCNSQDLEFVPMVVEVFGSWGKKAQPVIKFISQAVALHKKLSFEQVDVYLRQRAALCYNATMPVPSSDTEIPTPRRWTGLSGAIASGSGCFVFKYLFYHNFCGF